MLDKLLLKLSFLKMFLKEGDALVGPRPKYVSLIGQIVEEVVCLRVLDPLTQHTILNHLPSSCSKSFVLFRLSPLIYALFNGLHALPPGLTIFTLHFVRFSSGSFSFS